MAWTPPNRNRRRQVFCIAGGILLLILLGGAVHPTTRSLGAHYAGYATGILEPTTDSLKTELKEEPEVELKYPPPPTYEVLRKWEAELPQHNLDLPFPEGRTGRYVKFSNQMGFVGWNNCLNERLMNAHLAYMSKRAYVFGDYAWAPEHYPWPPAQHPPGLLLTPLNAILGGPIAGGPWDPDDDAPRAISERWWPTVCPPSEVHVLNTSDVKPFVRDVPGAEVFAHWQRVLQDIPERCVEVVPAPWDVDNMPQVFDLWIWGNPRVLSLWPLFRDSPTSRLLAPSPIVQSAIARNAYLFLPRGPRVSTGPRDPFDRMFAVHVRRGDYLAHCKNLAAWGSTYYSWAQLPELVDQFTPLPEGDPRREEAVLGHCLPTTAQLVRRIGEARSEYVAAGPARTLDVLYLLTNEEGGSAWLKELRDALKDAGWHTLVTTAHLALDAEQEEVSMAVDMQIARQAAVFMGNGWSSFTSNIIHQRLVDGREPLSIRLT